MWSIWGETLESDNSAKTIYQRISVDRDIIVKAIRTGFVFWGAPTWTTLSLKIYDSQSDLPTNLRATCDKTWASVAALIAASTLTQQDYSYLDAYFDFTTPIVLRRDTPYHIVPVITGYTYSLASHISWKKAFPDLVNETAEAVNLSNIQRVPFDYSLIGADR